MAGAMAAALVRRRRWRSSKKKVADGARFSPFKRSPLDMLLGRRHLDHSPMFLAAEMMARVVSPYDKPGNANPLAAIFAETIDFPRLVASPVRLFIIATSVRTGRGRVFRNHEITPDVLMASACLPTMFRAVEIGDEHYWDGGYSGKPTITPLIRKCQSSDTMLAQINPVRREKVPTTPRDIVNRLSEISFNAVLLKELQMIALLRQVADADFERADPETARWAGMRVHRIASATVDALGASSKLNAERELPTMLRDEGRRTADPFLRAHRGDVGVCSTFDIDNLTDED